jgi:hypothetical protein
MRSHDRMQLQDLWGRTWLDLAKFLAFARLGPTRRSVPSRQSKVEKRAREISSNGGTLGSF